MRNNRAATQKNKTCVDAIYAVLGQCEDSNNAGYSNVIVQTYTNTNICKPVSFWEYP